MLIASYVCNSCHKPITSFATILYVIAVIGKSVTKSVIKRLQ
nr:MAG TPA: SAGA-associated factor 73-FINGER, DEUBIQUITINATION, TRANSCRIPTION FACTOR, SAGA [Bacteriophage sp.]